MGLLDGKVAVVTGSGRGIGRAVAELFAAEGAAVVINDLDQAVAEETARAIADTGGKTVVCAGSVTDPEFPGKIIQAAVNEFGKLDILVNNAGYTWDAMVHKMTDEQWYAMIDVHATASFRMIRAAAPYLRDVAKEEIARGERVMRKIINVMSIAGTMGNAGQANYSAAKAALGG
ncbi:MAG: SDR family NAD(P)-dependent oxidoreductase, partial [Moorella sp. (in: Bacteria)]|nr:SDR family NAD(P)-dependent oxidoreductase [Moorella sp. (in: firmicutes)]